MTKTGNIRTAAVVAIRAPARVSSYHSDVVYNNFFRLLVVFKHFHITIRSQTTVIHCSSDISFSRLAYPVEPSWVQNSIFYKNICATFLLVGKDGVPESL